MNFRNQKIHNDLILLIKEAERECDAEKKEMLIDVLKYVNKCEARILGLNQTICNLRERIGR